MRSWTALALLATALLSPLAATASATAPPTVTSVTVVSETGEFIGTGRERLFVPHNGTVAVSARSDLLLIEAAGGTSNDGFRLEFEAPPGEVLVPRTYDSASSRPFQPGRARMAVSGAGYGCNGAGRFTVLDLAFAGDAVERLHLLYEQHCDGVPSPALFGEIRYQLPAADAELFVAPGHAVWPQTHPGVGARPVPVTLHNPGAEPVNVGVPRIEGASAESFSVHGNACTAPLEAEASCVIYVRFTPTTAGPHRAVLVVPDSTAAGRRTVALAGVGHSGATSWQLRSEGGDYIGDGASYFYTPREAFLDTRGHERLIQAYVEDGEGPWLATFRPRDGDVLQAGRTYDGVDLRGHARFCLFTPGHFTVHELAFGPEGLERLSVTFQQRCERGAAALVGSIAYRAEQPARPLPEVTPIFPDTAGDPHVDNIEALVEKGFASGYADGTYRPQRPVTRGQLATLIAVARNLEPAKGSAGFTDTAGTTHEAAIEAVVQAGIASGYGDGSFRPDDPVSRGQLATFLVRAYAYALSPASRSWFRDTAGDVHAAAIDAVAHNGIASGYGDGTFRPAQVVTRGQVATFLVRASELPPR